VSSKDKMMSLYGSTSPLFTICYVTSCGNNNF